MKRIFRYYSYKQRWEMTEKECQEALGEEKFNAMKAEAIDRIDRTNSIECDFGLLMSANQESPFIDWCVEEYTGRRKHSIALTVLAVFACVAVAIIKWLCGPVQWVRPLFTGFGVLICLLGTGLMMWAITQEDAWKRDLSYPLLFAGLIILAFIKHLL